MAQSYGDGACPPLGAGTRATRPTRARDREDGGACSASCDGWRDLRAADQSRGLRTDSTIGSGCVEAVAMEVGSEGNALRDDLGVRQPLPRSGVPVRDAETDFRRRHRRRTARQVDWVQAPPSRPRAPATSADHRGEVPLPGHASKLSGVTGEVAADTGLYLGDNGFDAIIGLVHHHRALAAGLWKLRGDGVVVSRPHTCKGA